MSYIAVTFPTKTSKLSARTFAESVGLSSKEVVQIKEGVFGIIMPADVSREVLASANKHNGKVVPYVESSIKVAEGSWITTTKAARGIRFEMSGTTASNPVEGRILPDKYFVLGLQESNGGVFATLGRVDHLADIGRKNGPGRFVYNVDLDILRESMIPTPATDRQSKASDTVAESDRSVEIMDMLLENDPYINKISKSAKANSTVTVSAQENSNDALLELLEQTLGTQNYHNSSANDDAKVSDVAAIVESSDVTHTDETEESEEDELDPETFADVRELVEAMEADGIDIDNMNEEELKEAIEAYLNSITEEDSDPYEEIDAGNETDESEEADSDEDQDEKNEETESSFEDSGFEESSDEVDTEDTEDTENIAEDEDSDGAEENREQEDK